MRSLVIGASGQVGALLYRGARRDGDCLGTYRRHPVDGLVPLDLRDDWAVARLIDDFRPEVCYLPAALTHVDRAEVHRDECHAVNVVGVANVARAVAKSRSSLVFFSTEHVFSDREQ